MAEVLLFDPAYAADPSFNTTLVTAIGEVGHTTTVLPYPDLTNLTLKEKSELEKRLEAQIEECHAAMLGGSPANKPILYPAGSAEALQPAMDIVLPKLIVARKSVGGVCLGLQAGAVRLGAEMKRDEDEIENGIGIAQIKQGDAIFNGVGDSNGQFKVASYHWASVELDPVKAPKLRRLASSLPQPTVSLGCENLVIGVVGLPIYFFQNHPEGPEKPKKSEDDRQAREAGRKVLDNLLNSEDIILQADAEAAELLEAA